ncbi:MAG: VapC toxin family PIN domain ribonuclease [Hyphomonas sp.]
MILFDTSAWVDHFGPARFTLSAFLETERVVLHPFALGEIARGSIRRRSETLLDPSRIPQVKRVSDQEVLLLIEAHGLFSRGIGLVDAHLLTSAIITPPVELRTPDRRLAAIASALGAGSHVDSISL